MARAKKDTEYKQCAGCLKRKVKHVNFYVSDSPMFPDGRVSLCKECIQSQIDVTNVESVKRVLRQIDKPFVASIWQKCLESGKEPFGWYLRQISSLPYLKGLRYEDSTEDQEIDTLGYKLSNEMQISEEEIYEKPSIEVIRKWGTGYSNKEYYELESTWNEMVSANDISTPQHRTNLKIYCQLKVKLQRALEGDQIKDFETLNKQFNEVQKSSGFRPIDRKTGSESTGIRSFGVIFEEVERDGFILPWDIQASQDIVDKTILYMSNYTRKLLNLDTLFEVPDDAPLVDGEE